MFAWIFFRAENVEQALSIVRSVAGLNGNTANLSLDFNLGRATRYFVVFGSIAILAPNSLQTLKWLKESALSYSRKFLKIEWTPSLVIGAIAGMMTATCLVYSLLGSTSEFLYFQF
jgi:hypothetical protein